jgi:glycosyltransferase involved in cell wall biosynthesis
MEVAIAGNLKSDDMVTKPLGKEDKVRSLERRGRCTFNDHGCGKCKTLFFISSLAGGGAERVMVDLLRNIDRSKLEPTLVLLYPYEDSPYRQYFPQNISVIIVTRQSDSLPSKLLQILNFMKTVYKEKPKVILSMLTHNNIMAILSGLLFRTRVIACEHNTLSEVVKTKEGRRILGVPVVPMVKILYRLADKVIAVSEGIKSNLISDFGIMPEKVKTIYNPIDLSRINALIPDSREHPFFKDQKPIVIAMGRLTPQKGFDILLKSFSRVISEIDARLIVMGEGPQRAYLENMIRDLGIADKASLAGFQRNPYALLAHSDVFVLSSQYEGLPMAILEAMACGIPIISTDCRSGPKEILQSGQCGILVPVNNETALADAITRLLKDREQREEFSKRGKERMKDFAINEIVRQYENVICEVASLHKEDST